MRHRSDGVTSVIVTVLLYLAAPLPALATSDGSAKHLAVVAVLYALSGFVSGAWIMRPFRALAAAVAMSVPGIVAAWWWLSRNTTYFCFGVLGDPTLDLAVSVIIVVFGAAFLAWCGWASRILMRRVIVPQDPRHTEAHGGGGVK